MRYQFLKYASNSKVDCRSCRRRKCFTLYMDMETGEIMPNEFGRCDRENGCGYSKHPNIDQPKSSKVIEPIIQVPQQFIDKKIVSSSMAFNIENEFFKLLETKFGQEKVDKTVMKYMIGTSKTGGVGYFCIDSKGRVTSCKVIVYNGFNRNHNITPFYPFKTSDGYYPCLFGQHLVTKDKTVRLVESEKTAIIGDIVYPEFTWISCGGTNNLTAAKCKILKESRPKVPIQLIPDCDDAGRKAMIKWTENLSVFGLESTILELDKSLNDGTDYADLIWQNFN